MRQESTPCATVFSEISHLHTHTNLDALKHILYCASLQSTRVRLFQNAPSSVCETTEFSFCHKPSLYPCAWRAKLFKHEDTQELILFIFTMSSNRKDYFYKVHPDRDDLKPKRARKKQAARKSNYSPITTKFLKKKQEEKPENSEAKTTSAKTENNPTSGSSSDNETDKYYPGGRPIEICYVCKCEVWGGYMEKHIQAAHAVDCSKCRKTFDCQKDLLDHRLDGCNRGLDSE